MILLVFILIILSGHTKGDFGTNFFDFNCFEIVEKKLFPCYKLKNSTKYVICLVVENENLNFLPYNFFDEYNFKKNIHAKQSN